MHGRRSKGRNHLLYFLRLFFNFLFTPYENGTNWVIITSYVFWNEEYKPTGFLVDKAMKGVQMYAVHRYRN